MSPSLWIKRGLQDGLIWRLDEVTNNVGSVPSLALLEVSLLLHCKGGLLIVAAQLPTVLEQGPQSLSQELVLVHSQLGPGAAQQEGERQANQRSFTTASCPSSFCPEPSHPTHPTLPGHGGIIFHVTRP